MPWIQTRSIQMEIIHEPPVQFIPSINFLSTWFKQRLCKLTNNSTRNIKLDFFNHCNSGHSCRGRTQSVPSTQGGSRRYERVGLRPSTALPSDPQHYFSRKEFNHYFPSAYRFLKILLGESKIVIQQRHFVLEIVYTYERKTTTRSCMWRNYILSFIWTRKTA